MNAYCAHCGEPWDHDTIHDVAGARYEEDGNPPYYLSEEARLRHDKNPAWDEETYSVYYRNALRDFQTRGCVALGGECSEPSTETDRTFGLTRQEAAGALYDVLGDDMDGMMAEMEDLGW